MSYGYVGDTSTSIKQQVKNAGVLSVSDVLDLEGKGQLGGSLELIEEQTISSAFADFTSLQENKYDVLLFQLINVKPNTTGNIGLRLSNNSGSSYISSGYQYAWQRGFSSGTFDEVKATTKDRLIIAGDATTTGSFNMYIYCYNFGNASKYSFVNLQGIASNSLPSTNHIMQFGGGVYPTAEVHNAVRFGTMSFNALTSATIKLYGVKQL